jgi:hypothetical protein
MINRITHNGVTFNAKPAHAAALEVLMDTNGGGFATVKGYVSSSGRISPETSDIHFISRFKVTNLYVRKRAAIETITFQEILPLICDNPKIKLLTLEQLEQAFNDRKAYELASIQKTLDGDRSDGYRQAHDRNYHTLVSGVKVNFVTQKDQDGKEVPILDSDGYPTVGSILLNIIQVNKTVIVEGQYKPVNSGVPVIISNAMDKLLPKSCKIKTISLKDGNFESLQISNTQLLSEQFKGL